ncbi:TPA: AAA family ATPase [Yersinia enterocolitica]
MDMSLQLTELLMAGLKGDSISFQRLASKLARSYDSAGNHKIASEIRAVITGQSSVGLQRAKTPSMVKNNVNLEKLPIDREADFELADITEPSDSTIAPLLNEDISIRINEFITFVDKAEELKKYGLGLSPSMILFGPPGCGKTMAAKNIASMLRLPMITARCDSLVSSYLGSTSKNIRQLFDYASSKPCVLFLDEFDALAKARDDQHELGELKRVVVSLLQNIDSLPDHTILLAASNHDSLLDSAIWRRFAYRISIGLPDALTRERLFYRALSLVHPPKEIISELSILSGDLSCAFIEQACERALRHAFIFNNGRINYRLLIESILESKNILSLNSTDDRNAELVRYLREYAPKVFTIRRIAFLLELSPTKVSRLSNQHKDDS